MKTILMLCAFVSSFAAFAQRTVTGRVLDQDTRKPIVNATVRLFPTTIKTSTNALGYFQLTITNVDSLLILSPGYTTISLKVPREDKFQVSMRLRDGESEKTKKPNPPQP